MNTYLHLWYLGEFLKWNTSEKAKTQFHINFFSENCSVYEILWKNVVETDRSTADDNIIGRRK
jgi:hypothetical protein